MNDELFDEINNCRYKIHKNKDLIGRLENDINLLLDSEVNSIELEVSDFTIKSLKFFPFKFEKQVIIDLLIKEKNKLLDELIEAEKEFENY